MPGPTAELLDKMQEFRRNYESTYAIEAGNLTEADRTKLTEAIFDILSYVKSSDKIPWELFDRYKVSNQIQNYIKYRLKEMEIAHTDEPASGKIDKVRRFHRDTLKGVMAATYALLTNADKGPGAYASDSADGTPPALLPVPRCTYERRIIDGLCGRKGDKIPTTADLSGAGLRYWPIVKMIERSSVANPLLEEVGGTFRDDCVLVYARPSITDDQKLLVEHPATNPEWANWSAEQKARAKQEILAFPEAGPRQELRLMRADMHKLQVGLVVVGAISPGINAVIDGICERHELYQSAAQTPPDGIPTHRYSLEILGYRQGLHGIVHGAEQVYRLFHDEDAVVRTTEAMLLTRESAHRPGSVIGTSRLRSLETLDKQNDRTADLDAILDRFIKKSLNVIYVIGGEGGMKFAHVLQKMIEWRTLNKTASHISVIAIPKSMDSDILFCTSSLGFASALSKSTEFIDDLHNEIVSNPRLCIVSLFGSASGFMVANSALASGLCDAALIPEVPYTLESLAHHMIKRLSERYEKDRRPYGMILVAETAVPQDIRKWIDAPEISLDKDEKAVILSYLMRTDDGNRPLEGHTPDGLGSAVVKAITRYLKHFIEAHFKNSPLDKNFWKNYGVFSDEPRYLIRAVAPSGADQLLGHRLGTMAVDAAMAGYTDAMVSNWNSEYVIVPLTLVTIGRKRVPQEGIFWRSVIASTKQPKNFTLVPDRKTNS